MSEYKPREAVVCFLDILGASSLIKSNSEKSLNEVHKAYDSALKKYKSFYKSQKSPPKIRIFSDNIVIFQYCSEENTKQVFYSMVILCSFIQQDMLLHNFLIRGGITKGDFFFDDILVWGNALVDAYNLENNIAIYPRIVINPDLIGEIKFFENKDDLLNKKYGSWLYQDYDGLVYIDYLHDFPFIIHDIPIILFYLEQNENRIVKNLNNLKVCQKLVWHRTYLLRKLNELGETDVKNNDEQ